MKLKSALHNNIVVKQIDEEESKFGNIIIPDLGKELGKKGKVVMAGPGSYTLSGNFIPTTLKVDDIIVYPSFGGSKIIIDNEEMFVFKEQDLLVILEND